MGYNIDRYNSEVSVVNSEGNEVSGYTVYFPTFRQRYNYMSYDVSSVILHCVLNTLIVLVDSKFLFHLHLSSINHNAKNWIIERKRNSKLLALSTISHCELRITFSGEGNGGYPQTSRQFKKACGDPEPSLYSTL